MRRSAGLARLAASGCFLSMLFIGVSSVWAVDYTVPPDLTSTLTLSAADTLTVSVGGSITVSPGNAVDITGNGVTINNAGTITGEAVGIFSNTIDGITITNSGTLNATSAGLAYGIRLLDGSNNTVTNTGDVVVTGTTVSGIRVYGDFANITNSGTGTVTLTPTATGWAEGLRVANYDNATIVNDGTITTDLSSIPAGTSWTATMELQSSNGSSLTNNGTLSAQAPGGSSVEVYGIWSGSNDSSPITNTGIINMAGTLRSYGIYISGDQNSTITNSGTITLSGTGTGGAGVYLVTRILRSTTAALLPRRPMTNMAFESSPPRGWIFNIADRLHPAASHLTALRAALRQPR